MINNIFENCPSSASYSLYADDAAFWVEDKSLLKVMNVGQHILDNITLWSHENGLQTSTDKTKSIIFTYKNTKNTHPLTLNSSQIKFQTNIKFLGINMDKRLTWKTHVDSVISKCQSDLRLLRIVSNNNWGADQKTLKTLYTSLIVSKISYGDILYTTASKTNLKRIDRIQYEATRIILGALKCTHTTKLEAEAEIMPLTLVRKKHLAAYGCSALSVPKHPVAKLLKDRYTAQLEQQIPMSNKIQPISEQLNVELLSLNIKLSQIPQIPMESNYETHTASCKDNLLIARKCDLTPKQWNIQFGNLTKTFYPKHLHVYCDGSKSSTGVGSAAYSKNTTLMTRHNTITSTYTSELYALYMTLEHIRNTTYKYVVFTDSYSIIQALNRNQKSKHYLEHKIRKLVSSIEPGKVNIEWVPSHQGIYGNEQADKYAKLSTKLPAVTCTMLALPDIKKHINKHYYDRWNTQWEQTRNELLKYKPNIKHSYNPDIPRQQQVKLTRLRLNTTLLTHKHYFTKDTPPECDTCYTPITIQHILVECTKYTTQRTDLQQYCDSRNITLNLQSILQNTETAGEVIEYLVRTRMYNQI